MVKFISGAVLCIAFTSLNLYSQEFVRDQPFIFLGGSSMGDYQIGFAADYDFGSEFSNDQSDITSRLIWVQGINFGTKTHDGEHIGNLREGFGAEIFKPIGHNGFIGVQYLPLDINFGLYGYWGSSFRMSYQVNSIQFGLEHGRNGYVFKCFNPFPDKLGNRGRLTLDAGYYRGNKRGLGLQMTKYHDYTAVSVFATIWRI